MPEVKIIDPRQAVNIVKGKQIPVRIDDETVKVSIKDAPVKVNVVDHDKAIFEFNLNMQRALNGDLMIFDHKDIDIIILLEKKKVVAFAKDLMSDIVYGAENRLFEFLKKRGIIAYDSIQGGNVYGSLEGLILESKDKKIEPLQYTLFQISEWMKTEKPYFEAVEAHDEMMDDALLHPDAESSTELGEVPHEEEKGSILQRGLFAPYLYGRYTY